MIKKYLPSFIVGWMIGYYSSILGLNIYLTLVIAFFAGAILEGVRIWWKSQKKDTGKT